MRYAYQAYIVLQFIDFARFCRSGKAFTRIRQNNEPIKIPALCRYFLRKVSNAFNCDEHNGDLAGGCGSIISRTMPGQGHGSQYYPGVQWDVRDSARYVTILICHSPRFSILYCCRSTYIMARMVINVHPTHQLQCVLPRYPAVAQAEIPLVPFM